MDDSERSYGYSQDIYHGRRGAGGHYDRTRGEDEPGSSQPEPSYEYGPEGSDVPGSEEVEVSPEEAAIHVEDRGLSRTGGDERDGHYDHGRGSTYADVESFTWDNPGPDDGREPES
jgi:hypothetical protein